jgi:hypothetical protein
MSEEKKIDEDCAENGAVAMEVVMASTNMDAGFAEGRLMESLGLQNAGPGHVGSISSPIPVRNIKIDPTLPDPVIDNFPHNDGCGAQVRGLLFRIKSKAGKPSTCKTQLLGIPHPARRKWRKLSGEITLKYAGVSIFTDPRGTAHVEDHLFGSDYDSKTVTILGKDELRGQSGNYTVDNAPFDLSAQLDNDGNARGMGIVSAAQKLYPHFISANAQASYGSFKFSKVIRLGVSGKDLSFETKALLGKNTLETTPVKDAAGNVQLLFSSAGDAQRPGFTNGTDSNICLLPALGAWPQYDPDDQALQCVLMTGDAPSVTIPGYDFHSMAAAFRDEDSLVYILTTKFGDLFQSLSYRIYLTTVGQLLSVYKPSQTGIPNLSSLVGGTNGILTVVDENIITSSGELPYGIYHPAINLIQHPTDIEKDLVVLTTGSQIIVSRALAYGSPTAVDQPEANPNPYLVFANTGGVSLNSITFPIESLYEAERNEGSFKRGARIMRGGGVRPAARAALGAAAAAPAVEEDEEKDK